MCVIIWPEVYKNPPASAQIETFGALIDKAQRYQKNSKSDDVYYPDMVDDPTSDDLLLDLDETHAAVLRATQSDQQEKGYTLNYKHYSKLKYQTKVGTSNKGTLTKVVIWRTFPLYFQHWKIARKLRCVENKP